MQASEELEERESLAQIAASGENTSLSDGETYIGNFVIVTVTPILHIPGLSIRHRLLGSKRYWDLNLYQSALHSIRVWVIKKEFVILHEFKWRVGVHFVQNAAKNNDLLKKCSEQKLLWIQFSTKNSVDKCLYLPLQWR